MFNLVNTFLAITSFKPNFVLLSLNIFGKQKKINFTKLHIQLHSLFSLSYNTLYEPNVQFFLFFSQFTFKL